MNITPEQLVLKKQKIIEAAQEQGAVIDKQIIYCSGHDKMDGFMKLKTTDDHDLYSWFEFDKEKDELYIYETSLRVGTFPEDNK